jgi:hypothetical protein
MGNAFKYQNEAGAAIEIDFSLGNFPLSRVRNAR